MLHLGHSRALLKVLSKIHYSFISPKGRLSIITDEVLNNFTHMNITINILWLLPVVPVCTSLAVFINALIIADKGEEINV